MTTHRTALSFSRALEFSEESELVKRMGCAKPFWLRAVVKELVDNGLDACEEAGIAPEISVKLDGQTLAVRDNGPGMSADLVERLCDRTQRTSSREAYAAPTRGAQGNAIQTLMCLPLAYGMPGGMVIASGGVEHVVTLQVNRVAGRIDLDRATRTIPVAPGTTVTMTWPLAREVDGDDVSAIIARFAALNPHAEFRLDNNGEPEFWHPFESKAAKWPTGAPTPVHWYAGQRFAHRVRLEFGQNPDMTVAEFMSGFAGFSGSMLRKTTAEAAGLTRAPLSALLNDDRTDVDGSRTTALYWAMRERSREPSHAKLGGVGKTAAERWISNRVQGTNGAPFLFTFKAVDGVSEGVPWRWELGFAVIPSAENRRLLIGQNFSPAISPLDMLRTAITSEHYDLQHEDPVALFMHRISPARTGTDYGKTTLSTDYAEKAAVTNALRDLAAPWFKHQDKERRGRRTKLVPEPKLERVTIKDAVHRVLPASYQQATTNGKHPATMRQLYYAVRPKVLALTGDDELKYGTYTQIYHAYRQEHPETNSWLVYCKARGTLIEPHTGKAVPLGTAEVDRYIKSWRNGEPRFLDLGFAVDSWDPGTSGPYHRYSALVIVEKEGIADILTQIGIGRKYDVAIVGNEGQSVEAELKLADKLQIPIFMLHDFDRSGLSISQNLRAGTKRHFYENVITVIEVGLRFHQIDGLESEPITKKQRDAVGDDRLTECGATQEELDYLRKRRVELNALTTRQLIEMVEGALDDYGVKKVIPEADALKEAWRAASTRRWVQKQVEAAAAAADAVFANIDVPDDLVDQVREILEQTPTMSWDAAILEIV